MKNVLMPTKHSNFSKSLFGFGSYLLTKLSAPKSVDDLWTQYLNDFNAKNYPAKHSFDSLLLTLVALYAIGIVQEDNGVIRKCA